MSSEGWGGWWSVSEAAKQIMGMPAVEEQEDYERAYRDEMIASVLELQEGGRRAVWRWNGDGQEFEDAPDAPDEFTNEYVGYTAAVGDGRGRAIIACQGHQSWWELDESRPTGRVRALGAGPPDNPHDPRPYGHCEATDWSLDGARRVDWSLDGTRHVLACVWL